MDPLQITEVFCYICRGLLIEPVTLPCTHVFCLTCFDQSMQETSYSCPLCRRRISNWIRSVKKSNSLINEGLWKQIKEQYKEQVLLKLNGEDDGLDQYMQDEYPTFASTSKPGEVAQEFSKLLNDFKIERERLREAEEVASKELINKLKAEEERQYQLLQEKNNLMVKEDSLLAKKLQEEINQELCCSSSNASDISLKSDRKIQKVTKNSSKKLSPKGPMDHFIKPNLDLEDAKDCENTATNARQLSERSASAESTDSIRMETNLFKPIKKVITTPPKQYPDGRIREISLTKVTPVKLFFNSVPPSSNNKNLLEGKKIQSTCSAFVDTNAPVIEMNEDFESSSKRLKFSSEEAESGILKDITLEENNDSNSSTTSLDEFQKKKSKKYIQENFMSSKKFSTLVMSVDQNEDDENSTLDTQDYLTVESSVENKLIEEQRKIEKIILQEKEDRELALKLSREWELEMSKKPQTRSMRKSTKKISNKKTQQTLVESVASRTRNKKK